MRLLVVRLTTKSLMFDLASHATPNPISKSLSSVAPLFNRRKGYPCTRQNILAV